MVVAAADLVARKADGLVAGRAVRLLGGSVGSKAAAQAAA